MRTRSSICTFAAFLLAAFIGPAQAAQTDLSSTPFNGFSAVQAKPNIMLLMDTSGSMGWGHMPDQVETTLGIGAIGYKAVQCNNLYYNPLNTYTPPKQADGTYFPVPSFIAAPYDGFDTGSPPVNLSNAFKAYDDNTLRTSGYNDTPQHAYYYVHTGGSPVTGYTTPTCADVDAGVSQAASDGGMWTRFTPSTAGQQTNFAIWYSFYRTRMGLTKTAASLAFTPLTDSFRVGFITMSPKATPDAATILASKYLPIADFDSTQRNAWFAKLFSQQAGGSSPAREGLARVGRHYAGKQDGINAGMTGDPVQYYCQQNFTIMTTDGYWNDQAESFNLGGSFIGGGVDKSGQALVGQQDNPLTAPSGDTPRPIYDGVASGTVTTTNNTVLFSPAPCGTYFKKTEYSVAESTSQVRTETSQTTQTTVQNLQSTSQPLQSNTQELQATSQTVQNTYQTLQSTNQNRHNFYQTTESRTQITEGTQQIVISTNQNLRDTIQVLTSTNQTQQTVHEFEELVTIALQSTQQTLRSTNQNLQSTTQTNEGTIQRLQSTLQNLRSTLQNLRSTTQITEGTVQNLESTVQHLRSTSQEQRTSTQVTESTSQTFASTYQINASTSQLNIQTARVQRSTSQLRSCDAGTELCTPVPVGSCTPGGPITCETITTGPTYVASCTVDPASAGNNWTSTTCTPSGTGPTPTGSCMAEAPVPGNGFTTTTCPVVTTGPTPVSSCNPALAVPGNAFTATNCTPNPTGPTAVASCSAQVANAGNLWTDTTCSTNTSGPTGVASCTSQAPNAGNFYLTISCGNNDSFNVPVSSCTVASPVPGNGYTTVSCNTATTTNVPVAACSAAGPNVGNSWTTTSCSNNNTTNVPVASCTPIAAAIGNSWTQTLCPAPATTGPFGVASCTGVPAAIGNNWTATVCGNNNTTNVPVLSCTASAANAGNFWTDTTCPAPISTTNVPVLTCTASGPNAGNFWTDTTCPTPITTTNVPVASCIASPANGGNAWTATTCPAPITTGPTPVSSCVAVPANVGNNWTATTCTPNNTTNVPVLSCTASAANAGNFWTDTTCPAPIVTTNVPVPSCTAAPAAVGNLWTTTTCAQNDTTNVPVAGCSPQAPVLGNGYTTTTCPAPTIVSGPTIVASCTPVAPIAGNGYTRTTCTAVNTVTNVPTCTPSAGPPLITCNTISTVGVPTASCTPQAPNAGNGWLEILCPPPIVTTNVPVATCVPDTANAGNNWTTTTCPAPITTGPSPTGSCTAAPAALGNNWTSTTCVTNTTGPFGVASCVAVPASGVNNWTATVCGNANTSNVPVISCAPQTGNAGNNWVTIACGNNDALDVPVATCNPQIGSAGNNWITINCAAPVTTTNVPVSSCVADPVPYAGNNFTTTTCGSNNVLNVPSGTCSASGPNVGNNWTTTTCPTLISGPSGAPSCAPQTGNAGNSWLTITCSNANTSNVPVASCVPVSPTAGNGYLTTSCNTLTTTDVPVASCSATPGTSGNSWVTTTCSNTNSTNVPVSSCTPQTAALGNNWTEITCPLVTTSMGSASCTPVPASAGNAWTTVSCPPAVVTGPTPVAVCNAQSANAGNGWTETTCGTTQISVAYVTLCTAALPNAGNNWVGTDCSAADGSKLQYVLTNTVSVQAVSAGLPVGLPIVTTTVSPIADVDGVCHAPPTPVAIPAPNPQPAGPIVGPVAVENLPTTDCVGGPPGTWPCSTSVNSNAPQSINSLADVAQYYYITDLRKKADWPDSISCDQSEPCPFTKQGVPGVGSGPEDDRRTHQHMTTFSVALGVSGTLQYRPDYKTAATGDFDDIRTGAKDWPLWPDPSLDYVNNKAFWNDPKSIDDFWHAAVNGRGLYFNASDPRAVVQGLAAALAGIAGQVGSGSGPGVSSLNPVVGNDSAFLAEYKTHAWEGDVISYKINLSTGVINTSTPVWSAKAKLNNRTGQACDTRKIYLIRTDGTKPANNLANFTWGTSECDAGMNPATLLADDLDAAERAHFGVANVSLLSQYATMTDGTFGTPDQRGAADDQNLVNYLRGQRGKEIFDPGVADRLYRSRDNVLGDIIGGQPVFVQKPFASYGDAGYASFKTAQATRTPMVYVAGNDGMLHAFNAITDDTHADFTAKAGQEVWAIIPSPMLPNLYRLADNNYKNTHRYFVDAAPVISDAKHGGTWKTLLVGGFNGGGKGYYALDVTDPGTPKALWEFKQASGACASVATPTAAAGQTGDCNLGYSFGQPVITKLTDGRWVVMVTSGYNNVNGASNGGDGLGFLYVLNAFTGEIIYKISTGEGDATTPSGLAQINNYVDTVNTDNTALRVYGTDLFGNIWRFDINDNILPAGLQVKLVGVTKDPGGVRQPITTKPELGEVSGKTMVFVGTGRLLGVTDLPNVQVQSIYGIVDTIDGTVSPTHADLRATLAPLQFTNPTASTRDIICTGTPLQCGSPSGWRIDLPVSGERVNVNPQLALGNLAVASNIPTDLPCDAGGKAWFNQLDYKSGLIVPGLGVVANSYNHGLIVGFARIKLPDGTVKALLRFSDSTIQTVQSSAGSGLSGKRVSWREVLR